MPSTASTLEGPPGTRTRLVESAAKLFSRQGYGATGVKAVLADANVVYGSLYHWFPGGKQQLGVAALTHGGELNRALIESRFPPGVDVVEATAASFAEAADLLEATDYADACPIATIALEVASTDEPMRTAAAEAFESWLDVLAERFTAAGVDAERAREIAVEHLSLMEGAILLARTTRSSTPLRIAGRAAADSLATALSKSSPRGRKNRR